MVAPEPEPEPPERGPSVKDALNTIKLASEADKDGKAPGGSLKQAEALQLYKRAMLEIGVALADETVKPQVRPWANGQRRWSRPWAVFCCCTGEPRVLHAAGEDRDGG